jgi:hypothetical protein
VPRPHVRLVSCPRASWKSRVGPDPGWETGVLQGISDPVPSVHPCPYRGVTLSSAIDEKGSRSGSYPPSTRWFPGVLPGDYRSFACPGYWPRIREKSWHLRGGAALAGWSAASAFLNQAQTDKRPLCTNVSLPTHADKHPHYHRRDEVIARAEATSSTPA